ncbi:hypothetical protein ACFSC1_11355 [Paracoccus aurantiacus]
MSPPVAIVDVFFLFLGCQTAAGQFISVICAKVPGDLPDDTDELVARQPQRSAIDGSRYVRAEK